MNSKEKNSPDQNTVRMQNCISAENLSAELDGEYHFSPDEQAHLAHCDRCRSLYESYRVIDDAVSRSLMVNCPAPAAYRIRKKVNRKLDQLAPMRSHEPIRFFALAARVAAVAAVAVMAGYLIFIDNPYSSELADDPVRPVTPVRTKAGPEKIYDSAAGYPGSVDIRNLRLAAAGDSGPVRFMNAEPEVKASHVALIPDSVKHVWLYPSACKTGEIETLFRSALKTIGIPLQNVKIDLTDPRSIRASVNLSRRQSVMLTRLLAGQKLQLTSSVQPQPEQQLFAGTGDEHVEYEAVFLPQGK